MQQVFNPYLPEGVYIPDGEPHVFGGRLYIYGSHDLYRSGRYCAGDYVVWSAPLDDLSAFTACGTAYRRRRRGNRLGLHCLWAPDCTRGADGRYYLYFCYDFENRIRVAVSGQPGGPFEYLGVVRHSSGRPYGTAAGDKMCFDPGVFTDEDGSTYLYSGFSPDAGLQKMLHMRGIRNVDGLGGQAMRLQSDMLTLAGDPVPCIPGFENSAGTGFEGHEMYEASSMRKVGGRYYFIYSTFQSHELGYAIGDTPLGPFRFGGVLISNADLREGEDVSAARCYWGNNHGSIEKVGEHWYVFYHRQTNKNEQTRQGCAERIEISADGHIRRAEVTSCGLNGGPLAGEGRYPAYIACHLRSAAGACKCSNRLLERGRYRQHPCIGEYAPGRQCILGMRAGASAGFRYFACRGQTDISVTVRGGGGKLLVSTAPQGEACGEIALEPCKNWRTFAAPVSLPQGTAALYFTYEGGGLLDFSEFTLRPHGGAKERT